MLVHIACVDLQEDEPPQRKTPAKKKGPNQSARKANSVQHQAAKTPVSLPRSAPAAVKTPFQQKASGAAMQKALNTASPATEAKDGKGDPDCRILNFWHSIKACFSIAQDGLTSAVELFPIHHAEGTYTA